MPGTTILTRRQVLGGALASTAFAGPTDAPAEKLENDHFRIEVEKNTGAIRSLIVKRNGCDLIGEKRLRGNFRICLPLPDYECNYIEGVSQQATVEKSGDNIRVRCDKLRSDRGEYPVGLNCEIHLEGDTLRFRAALDNRSPYPVAEFWYPRLGGLTAFGNRDANLAVPNYTSCRHDMNIFRRFPGVRGFGAEAGEMTRDYPGMTMPWWDLYDAGTGTGLYLGYHDTVCRFSSWHLYLHPEVSGEPGENWIRQEDAAGEPVGLVFSHVRYPFINSGEKFESGEFILRVHEGNWHQGSKFYRDWFLRHFPFDKSQSWLRKQRVWFSSILYQPEDRIVADYKTYDRWCRDAEQFGVQCHELIGWDKGGLERDYPEYIPEPKFGGRDGYIALQRSIRSRGSHCLTFVNYNVLDSSTDLYKEKLHVYRQQDRFGNTPNGMAWGESTLVARKGLSVHRHVLSSLAPAMKEILEGYFLQLVKDGAHGFQIDKTVASRGLDFNPRNTLKPDEVLNEGLVAAIGELFEKCRRLNPDFRIASEHNQDRLIPYVDVAYRACSGYSISPLRYVFPEWTSAQHITTPHDFRGVNGAAVTGAVICIEPRNYHSSLADPLYRKLAEYIREVDRLREQLAQIIFLGRYLDDQGFDVKEASTAALHWGAHSDVLGRRHALVIANDAPAGREYTWQFKADQTAKAILYAPFEKPRSVAPGEPVRIPGVWLQVLVVG